MINAKAYIDGKFVDSKNKVKIMSPIDLKICGTVPKLTKVNINHAFSSAKKAFAIWRDTPFESRKKILQDFSKLLLKHKKDLAKIMLSEIGKEIKDGISEIERTYDYITETIIAWEKTKDKKVIIKNKTSIQKRIPLGVVLAISPFNYPVNLSLSKIAPALLTGNVVVFKAATNGSLTGAYIAKLFAKLKMPKGVFNYVTGRGKDIGDTLTTHKEIDMVTFTGGVEVGHSLASKIVMRQMVLELGGNDAAYVRYDADLSLAIKEIIGGAFGYAGQRCTAIKRLIIHKKIAKTFIEKLIVESRKLKLNPLISLSAAKYIKELYDDAVHSGNDVLLKGQFNQNYVSPSIIRTTTESRVWKEEQFGPILPIVIVNSDKDAINIMNDSIFGLQNSLFTSNNKWAVDISNKIESGTVNINAKSSRGPDAFPFSGIKSSGFGTQGIQYALESMTRIINIVKNKHIITK